MNYNTGKLVAECSLKKLHEWLDIKQGFEQWQSVQLAVNGLRNSDKVTKVGNDIYIPINLAKNIAESYTKGSSKAKEVLSYLNRVGEYEKVDSKDEEFEAKLSDVRNYIISCLKKDHTTSSKQDCKDSCSKPSTQLSLDDVLSKVDNIDKRLLELEEGYSRIISFGHSKTIPNEYFTTMQYARTYGYVLTLSEANEIEAEAEYYSRSNDVEIKEKEGYFFDNAYRKDIMSAAFFEVLQCGNT